MQIGKARFNDVCQLHEIWQQRHRQTSDDDEEEEKKRCMLLLMLLSRLNYLLLLFIRFPSTAYQECRRSNTLHNEDIRTNLFSSSSSSASLYREICILPHNSVVVDSECEKEKKGGNDFSFSFELRWVLSSILVSLSLVYLTVRSCLFSLP